MPTVTEEATFLDIGGQRLHATFSSPRGRAARGVVLCHPLGEEKLWSHRPLVTFARDLASRGFAVARFDFRGEGDSDLDFEEATMGTRVEDTGVVITALRERQPDLSDLALIGLRFGANVAAAISGTRGDVDRLALWDPVIEGESYAQSLLRINLAAQLAAYRKVVEGRDRLVQRMESGETINIEGYGLTGRFHSEVRAIRLAEQLRGFRGSTLLLQPLPRGAEPRPELKQLQAALPVLTIHAIPEEPFWKETKIFFQRAEGFAPVTLDWLEGRA